jgi:hypothetical protein
VAIDPKFIIDLKGKSYPMYAGILAEAHERGLTSILTEVVQIPTEANGQTAIVSATVLMEEGKKSFQGIGDASPRNVARHLTEAVLRMAETRAKGRALRDAINCGMTMLEELPDLEDAAASSSSNGKAGSAPSRYGAECDQAVLDVAARGRERMATSMAANEQPMPVSTPGDGNPVCSTPGCGKALTKGQYDVSMGRFQAPLCPTCQKDRGKK